MNPQTTVPDEPAFEDLIRPGADARREQIISGAIDVFSEKGFDATSNKEVARAAGIASPGLIYHYFKDKQELLRESIFAHLRRIAPPSPDVILALPLRDGLLVVARHFVENMCSPASVKFVRVLLGEAMRRPEFAQLMSQTLERHAFGSLVQLFQINIDNGTLRADVDPTVAAVRFLGSLSHYLILSEVLRVEQVRALDKTTLPERLVDDFLYGIAAR